MSVSLSDPSTQKRLLAALLVVFSTVALWRSGVVGRWLDVGGLPGLGPRALDVESLLDTEVAELRPLEPEGGEYQPGRDPFRYAPKKVAPPPPPPPPPRPIDRNSVEKPKGKREPILVEGPGTIESGAQPPTPDFKYLGFFGPKSRQIAVLKDRDGLYNAQVGDVVKGKFQVDEIGYESVVLSFIGFPKAEPATVLIGG